MKFNVATASLTIKSLVRNHFTDDEQWSGQCRIGRRQSPIDLARDASVIGRYKPLFFKNYDIVIANATVRNTGHSCKYMTLINSNEVCAGEMKREYPNNQSIRPIEITQITS